MFLGSAQKLVAFFRLCDLIENANELGKRRLEAAEHLCNKDFFRRDCGQCLNTVFVKILLFHVCAFGNDFFHKRGVCLGFLCENRCTARFVRAEYRRGRTVQVVVEIGDTEIVERFSYKRVLVYFVFTTCFLEFSSKVRYF